MPLENIFRSEFLPAVGTFHRIRLPVMGKHMTFEAGITTTNAASLVLFESPWFCRPS